MFRKFKFEESVYEKLQSIPLSTQYKLDKVGAALSLKSWKRFSGEERAVLCHLPVRSQGELECYRGYLGFLLRRSNEKLEEADPEASHQNQAQWENLSRVPEPVYLKALQMRVLVTPGDWIQMDDLERYALFRLSTEKYSQEPFARALHEFLGLSPVSSDAKGIA